MTRSHLGVSRDPLRRCRDETEGRGMMPRPQRGEVMTRITRARLALGLVAAAALVFAAAAAAHTHAKSAPCIGTDQMGPKRFGPKGKLAFSFGDVAQDEGSAMAQFAWNKHWRTAAIATDTVIVYFKDIPAVFSARWKQLGGTIVPNETYQS